MQVDSPFKKWLWPSSVWTMPLPAFLPGGWTIFFAVSLTALPSVPFCIIPADTPLPCTSSDFSGSLHARSLDRNIQRATDYLLRGEPEEARYYISRVREQRVRSSSNTSNQPYRFENDRELKTNPAFIRWMILHSLHKEDIFRAIQWLSIEQDTDATPFGYYLLGLLQFRSYKYMEARVSFQQALHLASRTGNKNDAKSAAKDPASLEIPWLLVVAPSSGGDYPFTNSGAKSDISSFLANRSFLRSIAHSYPPLSAEQKLQATMVTEALGKTEQSPTENNSDKQNSTAGKPIDPARITGYPESLRKDFAFHRIQLNYFRRRHSAITSYRTGAQLNRMGRYQFALHHLRKALRQAHYPEHLTSGRSDPETVYQILTEIAISYRGLKLSEDALRAKMLSKYFVQCLSAGDCFLPEKRREFAQLARQLVPLREALLYLAHRSEEDSSRSNPFVLSLKQRDERREEIEMTRLMNHIHRVTASQSPLERPVP